MESTSILWLATIRCQQAQPPAEALFGSRMDLELDLELDNEPTWPWK